MKTFPTGIAFKHPWRSYQQRILDQLDHFLRNRHLHLVAPPGSGKTVLGLEIMVRLNEPTLILAPTLTIKTQWVERFVQLFLNKTEVPDWISTDIRNPRFLTVCTYQALHSLLSKTDKSSVEQEKEENGDLENEQEEIAGTEVSHEEGLEGAYRYEADSTLLLQKGFKTLILDEAHHLRSEWWKSIIQFRNSLADPNLIALTATPPYDTSASEWDRYVQLCGPIDLEISVPELVREKDLCPHQDYIYFSVPSKEEQKVLQVYRENVQTIRSRLMEDKSFVHMIHHHPWIQNPDESMEAILNKPGYFTSLLLFLRETSSSSSWKELSRILGAKNNSLPPLTLEWMEELLTGCLYQDEYTRKHEDIIRPLEKWLQRVGAIERRKVYLQSTNQLNRLMMQSTSKLQSIRNIVHFEAEQMKDALRLVVLTDYIRLADLPKHKGDEQPLNRLGVIPIFETLRREHAQHMKLGVISGSIVIIPSEAGPLFQQALSQKAANKFRYVPLSHDENYISVHVNGSVNQQVVQVITQLFSEGHIQVLIGTTALLGEGWDAPCMNTIVLASYVGTFMLSNQMRGRAIRIQQGNANKVSNIWHLVCQDPGQYEPGHDLYTLARRFRSFVGVSYKDSRIESGIERLGLEPPPYNPNQIDQMNQGMFQLAGNRQRVREQWQQAIGNGSKQLIEEIGFQPDKLPRAFVLQTTIRHLFKQALFLGLAVTGFLLQGMDMLEETPIETLFLILWISLAAGVAAALPKTCKSVWLLLRHGTVESSMKQVGEAVCETLYEMGCFETDSRSLRVHAEWDHNDFVHCWMEGGKTYEQTLFLDAVQETLEPIENPRYLLVRRTKRGMLRQVDYHAVPQIMGRKKEHAELFCKKWNRYVGKAELVFTRTPKGRKQLLQARMHSLSASFLKRSERVSVWK